MIRDEFRQQMELYRQAREQNPQLSYWEWKSIPKYESGTDGIQSNTSEIPVTYSNGKWNYGYNPGAGFLKPVVSIQDAADLTPVGNAITANDVYQSASQGDYITAGLIGAAALLPGAISKPLKKIVREIPSVNPKYFSDKINKVLGREVRPNGLSRDVYTDAINQRNRVIEDLYTDQDYWDRARAINEQYGDDYTNVYKGVLDTYENKYTGLPEPKAKQFFGDAKAEMAARKDAMERFRMNKIPAGYTDFEYNISPHLDRIDRPTAQHELGHYVDFNLSQNANADYNNNMFSALRRDLSTDNNPLYPDKTDYFRQGTEQKSYMNTLRSYMQSIGLMDRPGQKVTTKTIKRAINSLPSEMNAVRAAYLQFSSPGKYTKWFNKIPLLSIPGAAMYFDSKEDNSYADGTDGITESKQEEKQKRDRLANAMHSSDDVFSVGLNYLLNRKNNKKYTGSFITPSLDEWNKSTDRTKLKPAKRDLVNKYVYGDNNGFKKLNGDSIVINNKVYKDNLYDGVILPYDTLYIHESNKKYIDDLIANKKIIQFEDNYLPKLTENDYQYLDDVANYSAVFKNDNGNYSLTAFDLWDFGKSFDNQWLHGIPKIFKLSPSKIATDTSKPNVDYPNSGEFWLKQVTPIKFINSDEYLNSDYMFFNLKNKDIKSKIKTKF